jgi:hypothetical protein
MRHVRDAYQSGWGEIAQHCQPLTRAGGLGMSSTGQAGFPFYYEPPAGYQYKWTGN